MRLSKGSMMKRRTSMRCVDAREACSARRDLGRFLRKAAPPFPHLPHSPTQLPYVQVFCGDGTMLISELSVKIMDEFVKMKKALKLKLKPNVTSKAKTEMLMLRIFDENIYAWLDPSRPVREVVPNGGNVVAFLKRYNKRNPKPAADVAEEPAADDDEDNIAGTEEEGETDEEREENDEDGSDSDSDSEAEADDGESGKCLAVRPFETREMSGCLVYEAGAGAGASITPADVLAVEGADTTQAVGATTIEHAAAHRAGHAAAHRAGQARRVAAGRGPTAKAD